MEAVGRAVAGVERVVAGPAGQLVEARAAIQDVGARAARQRVVAGIAVQRVRAGAAGENVAAGRPVDQVGAGIACERVVGGAAIDRLDAGDRVGAALSVGDRPGRQVHLNRDGRGREVDQIEPGAAGDQVVPGTAHEPVIAGAADQRVAVAREVLNDIGQAGAIRRDTAARAADQQKVGVTDAGEIARAVQFREQHAGTGPDRDAVLGLQR